jgi:septum formation protein
LVLASQSPRRRDLLAALGLTFEIHPSEVDETSALSSPGDLVEELALRKADAIAGQFGDALILAADTIVVLENEVLNKPASPTAAIEMLRRLSGHTHSVYSGLALAHPASGRRRSAHETTTVTFSTMSEEEIAAYVASGSPLDKAGAYGIQDDAGALFIERIEGDYYNVVGLPLRRLYVVLRDSFPDLMGTGH